MQYGGLLPTTKFNSQKIIFRLSCTDGYFYRRYIAGSKYILFNGVNVSFVFIPALCIDDELLVFIKLVIDFLTSRVLDCFNVVFPLLCGLLA